MGHTYKLEFVVTVLVSAITLSWCADSEVISTQCTTSTESTTCYSLHKLVQTTWEGAYTECTAQGLRLAAITNVDQQGMIAKLVTEAGITGAGQSNAWLAGTRSNNQRWIDLEGTQFSDIGNDTETDAVCGIYNHGDTSYQAVPCLVTSGAYALASCQVTYQGGCPEGFTHLFNTCYGIPGNFTISWTSANQLCQETYPTRQGTLSYSHINTQEFKDFVATRLAKYTPSIPKMWVGVHRNPWIWVTGTDQDRETLLTYTNWKIGEGVSLQDDCLYIDFSDPLKHWYHSPCQGELSYFICDNNTAVPDNSNPRTTQADVSPTNGTNTPSPQTGELSRETIIIITCVCVGLVIILLVILTVLCVIRRDKKRKKENQASHSTGLDAPVSTKRQPKQRTATISSTASGTYDYPNDTYHSNLAKVKSSERQDRVLDPVEVDLYKAADSVRLAALERKMSAMSNNSENNPHYRDIFMIDET